MDLSQEYFDAKKVLEFVFEKASKNHTSDDLKTIEFANLHILKFRCQSILNSLKSYEINFHE